jgi:hypothetical protein
MHLLGAAECVVTSCVFVRYIYGKYILYRYICNLRYKDIIRRIRIPLKRYICAAECTVRGNEPLAARSMLQNVAHEGFRNRAMRHKHSVQQVLLMYQL